jgi:adenylylsulfate kinase
MKILIMGLPGSGKTTIASKLTPILKAKWINADIVRKTDQNFDYSKAGRIKQAEW